MINKIYYILLKTSKLYFPNIQKQSYYIGIYHSLMCTLLKEKGTLYTVKYLKECRLHFTRYLCGQPLTTSDLGLPLDKDGIPLVLLPLKNLTHNSQEIKFLMTILLVTRCLRPKKGEVIPVDLKSITDVSTAKLKVLDRGLLLRVIQKMGIKKQREKEFSISQLFMISKAGPNGPSTLTSYKSLYNYTYDNIAALLKITCLKGARFIYTLISKAQGFDFTFSGEDIKSHPVTRRLSVVKDPECKMRVIAIFD